MGKPCVSWRAKAMSPLMVFSDPERESAAFANSYVPDSRVRRNAFSAA